MIQWKFNDKLSGRFDTDLPRRKRRRIDALIRAANLPERQEASKRST